MKGLRFSFLVIFFLSFTLFSFADDDIEDLDFCKENPIKKGNADAPEIPASSINEFMPSSIVNNAVDAISGDYVAQYNDIVVPSIVPLAMSRSYRHYEKPSRSDSLTRYTIASGWNHPFYQMMEFIQDDRHDHHYASIRTSSGSVLSYDGKGSVKKDNLSLQPMPHTYKTVLTNCGSGVISGRTNLKNDILRGDRNSKQYAKRCTLTNGDGSEHLFRMCRYPSKTGKYDFKGRYYITAEHLPNGNKILYKYDDSDNIAEIIATNASEDVVFGSLSIRYYGDDNASTSVESSDGKKVFYNTVRMVPNSENYYLKDIVFNNEHSHKFHYKLLYNKEFKALSRHEKFEGQYIDIEYYSGGDNDVGSRHNIVNIKPYHHDDSCLNRTRLLREPVGNDAEPIITATFIYELDEITHGKAWEKNRYREVCGGKTIVYDALDNATIYNYNKRIISVEGLLSENDSGQRETYRIKKFYWANNDSKDSTNLIATTLSDKNGKGKGNDGVAWSRAFKYDKKGNVLEEVLYGNITGDAPETFTVHKKTGVPISNIECYATRYTYSKDGLNLITSKITDNGTITKYRYKTGTNLLEAELVGTVDDPIQLRTFYSYDKNACMTQKIVDDGITEYDSEKPFFKTQRLVTKIKPYDAVDSKGKAKPSFGFPEVVEEYYCDITTNELILISRVINSYDDNGLLSGSDVYDAEGQFAFRTTKEYDREGRLTSETDALGRINKIEYDLNDNVIEAHDFKPNSHVITDYDFANRPVLSKIMTTDMTSSRSTKNRYDYLGNIIAHTDLYGNETNYEYDEFSRLISTTSPEVLNENSDTIRSIKRQEYDILDNVTIMINENGDKTETTYNISNKPISIRYPDGTTEEFRYNLDGTLRSKKETNDTTIIFTYDFLGRSIHEERLDNNGTIIYSTEKTYNAFNMVSSTDAEGYRTDYEYDGAGRLIATTQEDTMMHQEVVYDALGSLESTKEWYGPEENDYTASVEVHDLAGRVIERRAEDGNDRVLETSLLRYDENDNLLETTNFAFDGTTTKMSTQYNDFNEPIHHTDALGNTTLIIYDHSFNNGRGQKVLKTTAIDPKGTHTTTILDALGRIESSEKKDPFGTIVAKHEIRYDAVGNRCRHTETVFAYGKEKEQQITAWEYGPLNRVKLLWERFKTSLARQTTYNYNDNGQLSIITKPSGISIYHTYDEMGRMQQFSSSDDSFCYRYTYDKSSRVIAVTDTLSNTTTRRSYDAAGRITHETLGNDLDVVCAYDRKGRTTRLSLPDNRSVEYLYDSFHLRDVSYQKDDTEYTHSYDAFGINGVILQATLIGKTGKASHSYDLNGRRTSTQMDAFTEELVYDNAGNVTSRISSSGGTENYYYDGLYQIIEEKGSTPHTYAYDSINNRIEKDGEEYSLGGYNELLAHGDVTYDYDLNGNITAKHVGGENITYAYDALGRLITVTEDDNIQISFTYDAFNRRMDKTTYLWQGDGWTKHAHLRFLYVSDNEVGAADDDGTLVEFRVLGLGRGAEIGAAIAVDFDDIVYAPIHDSYGHVVALVDAASGGVAERYAYTAYGEENIFDSQETKLDTSTLANPWRFCSKRTDDELGFVFFGKRYYCSDTGRWTTPDPRGFSDGPNLYAYIHNNPLSFFDLYGEWSCSETVGNIINNISFDTSNTASSNSTVNADYKTPYYNGPLSMMTREILRRKKELDEIPEYTVVGNVEVPDATIFYHPGINTSYRKGQKQAEALSKAHGNAKVHYIPNRTYGVLLDAFEFKLNTCGIITNNIRRSAKVMKQVIGERAKDSSHTVYDYGYSHGALIAGVSHNDMSKEMCNMIVGRMLSPGYILSNNGMRRTDNYIPDGDIVSTYACKHNQDLLAGINTEGYNIHRLASSKEAGFLGHDFFHPSLQKQINALGDRFKEQHGLL
ncbi:MAG: RHS repeat-associated core domain-containing protein [Waddliaceae bacterium]|jgi:RHS repeat-associated protein|nr:RHS repeat-associated core domain-containing protein [Waddliaceae bacterium]